MINNSLFIKMRKLVQINTVANWGSTGRIADGIGQIAMQNGWDSYIAYGRFARQSTNHLIRIGSDWDNKKHGILSYLKDSQGLGSTTATSQFIRLLEKIHPNILHLHNIHGYYINYELLFDYIKESGIPTFWTLHDCWSFTGHCTYFTAVGCEKWKTGCNNCPQKLSYPRSFVDRSKRNYLLKKKCFTSIPNLTLIPVSDWLNGLARQSFLSDCRILTIHNGCNIDTFRPSESNVRERYHLQNKRVVMAVASLGFGGRKGFDDLITLRRILDERYLIVMVGCSKQEIKQIPSGIIGLERTENIEELRDLYSAADIFINPTHEDNFPTTNIEALACGTPVITYNTGGSPESILDKDGNIYGAITEDNTPSSLAQEIELFYNHYLTDKQNRSLVAHNCRQRSELCFDEKKQFQKYVDLYEQAIG